ncbi:hypothetical protein V2J09_014711 [Rumex salicifolius]
MDIDLPSEGGSPEASPAAKKSRVLVAAPSEASNMEEDKSLSFPVLPQHSTGTPFADFQPPVAQPAPSEFPSIQEAMWKASPQKLTYRDSVVNGEGPGFTLNHENPMYQDDGIGDDYTTDDDVPPEEDDPDCPTITLTAVEKRELWKPWKDTLIVRLFDKNLGYMALRRRLAQKWGLSAPFSLIDIGNDTFIARFANRTDYDHVLTQGPWIIGDSYLSIRKWVPRFDVLEDKITSLVVWVRIPWLHIEYFDQRFLHMVGRKIGKVLRVDRTTAEAERGQFVRLSVEVDITKPLLSKFRLHGKIWPIQYEGLKMMCFKCGKVGHHLDSCGTVPDIMHQKTPAMVNRKALEEQLESDTWGTAGSKSSVGSDRAGASEAQNGGVIVVSSPAGVGTGSRFAALADLGEDSSKSVMESEDITETVMSSERNSVPKEIHTGGYADKANKKSSKNKSDYVDKKGKSLEMAHDMDVEDIPNRNTFNDNTSSQRGPQVANNPENPALEPTPKQRPDLTNTFKNKLANQTIMTERTNLNTNPARATTKNPTAHHNESPHADSSGGVSSTHQAKPSSFEPPDRSTTAVRSRPGEHNVSGVRPVSDRRLSNSNVHNLDARKAAGGVQSSHGSR